MTLTSYATSRYADPERDREALKRAWGRPRQPDRGPLVMAYDVRDTPARLVRTRSTERRDYGALDIQPVDELPSTVKDYGKPLPTEQDGWTLVSEQIYYNGMYYSVLVRHHCGGLKYAARSDWMRGAVTKQCGACFRPSKLMRDLGLGPKRKTCATCGGKMPKAENGRHTRRNYCSPECASIGKSAETRPQPREVTG